MNNSINHQQCDFSQIIQALIIPSNSCYLHRPSTSTQRRQTVNANWILIWGIFYDVHVPEHRFGLVECFFFFLLLFSYEQRNTFSRRHNCRLAKSRGVFDSLKGSERHVTIKVENISSLWILPSFIYVHGCVVGLLLSTSRIFYLCDEEKKV